MHHFFILLSAFVASALLSAKAFAGNVYASLPNQINPAAKYVFYSHGLIVEGEIPTPRHKKWGVYDFPQVKAQLADASYHLIATHRPLNTHPIRYAEGLAGQVTHLLEQGVPEANIYLIGFSRGGFITAMTSHLLKNKSLNFVILAACTSGLAKREDVKLHGHLLSIFETSDTVGSCDALVARSADSVSSFHEIAITTGKEHGAFYRPIDEWLLPVKSWIKTNTLVKE